MKSFLCCLTVALFLLSCSKSDDPNNKPGPINANFVDAEFEVGYHCICWDQKIATNLAGVGVYKIRMVAGTYDYTSEFAIVQGSKRRPAIECCDTSTISIFPLDKVAKDPPEFFGYELDTSTFALGDTIHVEIAVPAKSRVQIEISTKTD